MSRGRLAVHAHFYQPSRVDPWTGVVPKEPSAAPFHDWNQRVDAECYRPNAERGTLASISCALGHRQARLVNELLGEQHAVRLRDCDGRSAEVLLEQAAQLPSAHAEPFG